MDLEVLKKKVSTYKVGESGRVSITSDELLIEVLQAWEQWTGPASGFCKSIGVSPKGISSIIGRAKKLRREGFPTDSFKEVKVQVIAVVQALAATATVRCLAVNA